MKKLTFDETTALKNEFFMGSKQPFILKIKSGAHVLLIAHFGKQCVRNIAIPASGNSLADTIGEVVGVGIRYDRNQQPEILLLTASSVWTISGDYSDTPVRAKLYTCVDSNKYLLATIVESTGQGVTSRGKLCLNGKHTDYFKAEILSTLADYNQNGNLLESYSKLIGGCKHE